MKVRVSTRLILSVLVIETVMLSVLVWNSVRLISSSHAERLEYEIDEQTELLANLLAPGLATSDRAILLDSISLITRQAQISYATVYNRNGQLMAGIGEEPTHVEGDTSYVDAQRDGVFDIVKEVSLFGQPLGRLQVGYSIQQVEQLIRQTRLQNTTIAAVEILLSITATVLLGYLLTRSLRNLEEGAKALARDELQHRINVYSDDEMGDLARSFNRLAEHLSITRSELKREHGALVEQRFHLQTLLDGVGAVIVQADPDLSRIHYVSRESERLLGYPADEWLQAGFIGHHIHPDDRGEFIEQTRLQSVLAGSYNQDYRIFHKEGRQVWVRSINTIDRTEPLAPTCRAILLDITEQKQSEQEIVFLAEHDSLTGLFNRNRFGNELERALRYAERFGQEGALMFIDLDQFKYINDTLGHQAGDGYLHAISQRLGGHLRRLDVLGRLGGDEFGVILPNTNREQAETVAAQLLRALATGGAKYADLSAPVTASIGIVVFPTDGNDPGYLLAKADAAMYRAKDSGRNRFHTFRDGDQTLIEMQAKLDWENRIRSALEEDRFVLHFQPVFVLSDNTVSHYEVLLRMRDEQGALIAPAAFLGIAERFGLIREIDRCVVRKALQMQAGSCGDEAPLSLAINLSGRYFGAPEVLDWINTCLHETGAEPGRLIFEVTETAAVDNIGQAMRFIEALHALGCRVALDDFGVGYSSLHYLKHLSVDMIKLDGGFVRNLANDTFDGVFVKAMSEMASGLGIESIAEFVETADVVPVLVELGVDKGQGYYLAKPAPDCPYPCHP